MTRRGGRPVNASSFLDHISKVAPPPSTTSPILKPADSAQHIGLCMAGAHLLHLPLEIPCGHHICAQCLRSKAKSAHTLHCTSCDATHPLVPESATSPSALLLDLIAEQLSKCRACGESVKVKHLDQHLSSCCTDHVSVSVKSVLTKRDYIKRLSECVCFRMQGVYLDGCHSTIFLLGSGALTTSPGEAKPLSEPLNPFEESVKNSTITLKTGGPVREHMHSHAHKMSLSLVVHELDEGYTTSGSSMLTTDHPQESEGCGAVQECSQWWGGRTSAGERGLHS